MINYYNIHNNNNNNNVIIIIMIIIAKNNNDILERAVSKYEQGKPLALSLYD